MSIPQSVIYSQAVKPEATQARANLRVYRAEQAVYGPSGTNIIEIPLNATANSFIDFSESCISMKVTNKSTNSGTPAHANCTLDGGLLGCIKTLEIQHNGNRLEFINEYGNLNAMLNDVQMGVDHAASVENILNGSTSTGNPSGQLSLVHTNGNAVLVDNLVSAVLNKNYLVPAGWLVGSPLKIILTLQPAENWLKAATHASTAYDYQIENVEVRAREIMFNEVFNNSFLQALQAKQDEGMSYYGQSFVHSSVNLPNNSENETNVNFSANGRSVKGLILSLKPSADVASGAKYSITQRYSAGINKYRFEIQGKQYPSQAINVNAENISQAFEQVMQTFGKIGDLQTETLFSRAGTDTKYYDASAGTGTKFMIALPLEAQSDDQSVISGLNMSANNGSCRFIPSLSPAITSDFRIDIYSWCDLKVSFDVSGQMYTTY